MPGAGTRLPGGWSAAFPGLERGFPAAGIPLPRGCQAISAPFRCSLELMAAGEFLFSSRSVKRARDAWLGEIVIYFKGKGPERFINC